MHSIVEHSNTEKEGAGDKPMGDHLDNSTFYPVGIEDKKAEGDKTHM